MKVAYNVKDIPIMIHIDRGGDKVSTQFLFTQIDKHGTFADFEENLKWLSENYKKDILHGNNKLKHGEKKLDT